MWYFNILTIFKTFLTHFVQLLTILTNFWLFQHFSFDNFEQHHYPFSVQMVYECSLSNSLSSVVVFSQLVFPTRLISTSWLLWLVAFFRDFWNLQYKVIVTRMHYAVQPKIKPRKYFKLHTKRLCIHMDSNWNWNYRIWEKVGQILIFQVHWFGYNNLFESS